LGAAAADSVNVGTAIRVASARAVMSIFMIRPPVTDASSSTAKRRDTEALDKALGTISKRLED
jgi:hypothetical protein